MKTKIPKDERSRSAAGICATKDRVTTSINAQSSVMKTAICGGRCSILRLACAGAMSGTGRVSRANSVVCRISP